eukprot:CAMPEP_0119067710 /NCGR_PEP_ID=MMETSP1178-20130426/10082_1 /TAXON_ID=33656 /ORGANISM="unid sp, Strain CCMP2000" /LENGTH=72 /DNA_ID=CAMNT_0007049387 /DNA_START=28 /DNA_END=242 /DNA_ORIENTATION=+
MKAAAASSRMAVADAIVSIATAQCLCALWPSMLHGLTTEGGARGGAITAARWAFLAPFRSRSRDRSWAYSRA